MYKDFEDYGWDVEKNCHRVYAGRDKTSDYNVTITTWQSSINSTESILITLMW